MAETVVLEVHDRTKQAKSQIRDIIMDAITDVFRNEIVPAAKELSPVGDEPVRPGSKRNRDSIDMVSFHTKRGPKAKVFTTSGHGGFLEVGTSKMAAQPYLYPSVQKHIPNISTKVQAGVAAATKSNGKD